MESSFQATNEMLDSVAMLAQPQATKTEGMPIPIDKEFCLADSPLFTFIISGFHIRASNNEMEEEVAP